MGKRDPNGIKDFATVQIVPTRTEIFVMGVIVGLLLAAATIVVVTRVCHT